MESANLLQESDQYRVAQPNDILRILQDIQQEQSFITISLPRYEKILTLLLEIDEQAGHFVFDTGRTQAETQAILATPRVLFSSSLNGVSVRFSTPAPVEIVFQGSPALRSPLPVDMVYLQRREHYRTKVIGPCMCQAKLKDGTEISLAMSDLSLGGVRLQSTSVTPDVLPVGTVLHETVLDFRELGKVDVTLKVASHQTSEFEGLVTHYYGCHLQHLSRAKEAIIQKLVFSLELLNRPNTRNRRL